MLSTGQPRAILGLPAFKHGQVKICVRFSCHSNNLCNNHNKMVRIKLRRRNHVLIVNRIEMNYQHDQEYEQVYLTG